MVSDTRNQTSETSAGDTNDCGVGDSKSRTSHKHQEEEHLPHSHPPPLTSEMIMQQLLESQRNTEQALKNIEEILRNFVQNPRQSHSSGYATSTGNKRALETDPPKLATSATKKTKIAGQVSSHGAPRTVKGLCFNCREVGHYHRFCPYPPKKKQWTYEAHVSNPTMNKIPEGETVATGKFSSNQPPIDVLFNFGSLCSTTSQRIT